MDKATVIDMTWNKIDELMTVIIIGIFAGLVVCFIVDAIEFMVK